MYILTLCLSNVKYIDYICIHAYQNVWENTNRPEKHKIVSIVIVHSDVGENSVHNGIKCVVKERSVVPLSWTYKLLVVWQGTINWICRMSTLTSKVHLLKKWILQSLRSSRPSRSWRPYNYGLPTLLVVQTAYLRSWGTRKPIPKGPL